MSYRKLKLENPFIDEKEQLRTRRVHVGGSAGVYGACSIEDFPHSGNLGLTHEDAEGFLDYPTQFTSANFWRKDSGVRCWLYEEPYDDWLKKYGADAVRVFYHSGHGGMYNNGVFIAPMGGEWDNRWHILTNQNIQLGNERLRYLFLSTCLSLRVYDGHSPFRTWSPVNRGMRMIFGYETVSYDNRNYGRYFWKEWRKGKSFKDAFMAASWKISHDQIPVVCAMGRSHSSAVNRLQRERCFSYRSTPSNCWAWEWVEKRRKRQLPKSFHPQELSNNDILILSPESVEDSYLSNIARKIGVTNRTSKTIRIDNFGTRFIGTKNTKVIYNNNGEISLEIGKANIENNSLISEQKAKDIAKNFITDLGIDKGIKLVEDSTYNTMIGSANMKTEQLDKATAVETIVQFRQAHKNARSINDGSGLITVSVDNDGKITRLFSSVKPIVDSQEQIEMPQMAKARGVNYKPVSREEQFTKQIQRIVPAYKGNESSARHTEGNNQPIVKVINEKIGYDFGSSVVKPVHQRNVEIQMGDYAKRYKLRVDI